VGIAFGSSSVQVDTRSGQRIVGSKVVLAAGAWSREIAGLPRTLPIAPLKGQMLALVASQLRHAVASDAVYLVPRGDEVVVGATVEHAGFDTSLNADAIEQLRLAAVVLCPTLADAPVARRWAGIRPATPDMLPILGLDPDQPSLIYACGHSKNGILLAPETAIVTARLAQGLPAGRDLSRYSVARFSSQ
jgi:glycine oxidase